jgi:hypothetical protein
VFDGRLILYDAGDFLDDYAIDPDLHNDWSFIFLVEIDPVERRASRLRMLPVVLTYARVDIALGHRADEICNRMIYRCAGLGTQLQQSNEELELRLDTQAVHAAAVRRGML